MKAPPCPNMSTISKRHSAPTDVKASVRLSVRDKVDRPVCRIAWSIRVVCVVNLVNGEHKTPFRWYLITYNRKFKF